jgi:hypothetical protein
MVPDPDPGGPKTCGSGGSGSGSASLKTRHAKSFLELSKAVAEPSRELFNSDLVGEDDPLMPSYTRICKLMTNNMEEEMEKWLDWAFRYCVSMPFVICVRIKKSCTLKLILKGTLLKTFFETGMRLSCGFCQDCR